ncbi:MAG: hypothetical protein ACE5PO_05180 [Candidatus Bathyarchaeia archaeon]
MTLTWTLAPPGSVDKLSFGWMLVKYMQASRSGAKLTTVALAAVTANFAVLYALTSATLGYAVVIPLTSMTFVAVASLLWHLSSRSLHTMAVLKAMGAGSAAIATVQFSGLMLMGLAGASIGLSAGLGVAMFIPSSGTADVAFQSVTGVVLGGFLAVVAAVALTVLPAWRHSSRGVTEILKNA